MEIKRLPLGSIEVNCYLISTEKTAIVIDPGFYSFEVEDFLKQNSDKEKLILLTHCHFDHIGDAARLRSVSGAKIGIGELDNNALSDVNINLSSLFGVRFNPFKADITFADNDLFSVGDINFKVLHTPGHTVGGVCYLTNDILFSGDTLFNCSIGRTDFPGGSFEVLKKSVKRLYELPCDTTVYSGHGGKTTIGYEKNNNPFINSKIWG